MLVGSTLLFYIGLRLAIVQYIIQCFYIPRHYTTPRGAKLADAAIIIQLAMPTARVVHTEINSQLTQPQASTLFPLFRKLGV